MLPKLLIALLLHSQVICDPNLPTHCSSPIKAGETAPMAGTIVSDDLALSLRKPTELIEAEKEKIRTLDKIDLDFEKKLHLIEIQALTSSVALQKRRADFYEKLQNDAPLLEKPIVVSTITAVLLISLFYALNHIKYQ